MSPFYASTFTFINFVLIGCEPDKQDKPKHSEIHYLISVHWVCKFKFQIPIFPGVKGLADIFC